MLLKAHEWLLRGNCLRHCKWTPAEVAYLSTLQTWTSKAVIYAVNMTAGQYCDPAARDRVCEPVRAWARVHSPESVVVPVSVPYEKAVLQCPSESSPRLLTAAAQVMSELAKGGDTQVARYVAAKDFDAAAEAFGPLVRPEWQKRAKEREGGDKKDKKAKAHANGHSHSHGHGHGHGHSHGHHDKSDKSDKGAKKAKKDKESVGFGDAFAEYLDDGDALGGPFATASAPAPADDDAVVVVETMEELEEVAGLDAIADLDALAARAEPVREAGAAAAAAASSSEAESKRGAGGDAAGSSSEEKDKAPVGIEPTADELIAMWRAIKSRAGSKRPRDDAAAAAGEGQGADDSRGGSGGSGEGFAATEVEVADDDDAGAEAEGGAGEGGRPGETEEGGAEAAAEGASGGPVKAAKGRVLTETNLSALFPLIHQCYQSGQLVHFFCCDRHAVRGYLVPQARCRAATAANRLHYDNEKNFLSCEVCAFSDWEASGKSMASAKASGLVRTCGREYLVQDFDIIKFKIAAKAKE